MRSFKIFFLVVFCFLFSLKALAQISEYYPTEESSSSKYYVKAEVYTHNQTGNNLKTELTIDDSTYVTDKDNTAHNIYFYAENFEDDIRFRVTVYSYDGTSETETIEFSESEIKDGTRRGASDIGAAASLTIYRKAEIKDFSPKRFCINDQDDFNVSLKGDASIGDIKGSIIIERLENSGSEKYSTGIGSLSKSISVSDIVDNYDIPYGEELKVSFHNSYFSFYEENDEFSHKRDLFMLEPPEDISIDFTQPTCHDSKDATITIGNLPHSSEENTLRINLIKYFDEPSIPGENIELNEDEEIEDLYWGNQTTKLFPIDAGQSSITIDQDQLSDYMELTSGYYKIEAFYGDESASSLCSTDDTFYVDEPKPLKLNLNVEDFETSGGGSTYQIPKNGNEITISGSVTGNQNPYTIYYEDENEDENQFVLDETSLGAGDYTFWVDDDKCKSNDTTLSLDEPGSLDVDTNVYYPDCNAENTEDETKKTGSITFTIESGGIPNFYAELIDNGNNDTTTISGINRSDEKTINNLEPGTYTLKIWDKGDPKRKKTSLISKDFTISEPPEMTLTTTPTDVSCNGNSDGEIELNVKNGTASFSYSISENDRSVKFSGKNHTIDSISPDDYKVTVTDNNGCSVSESVSIEEPNSLQISKTDSNAATCKLSDGSLSFKVSGGWSDKKDSVVLEETGMDSEYESWALIEADADNRTVTFNDLSAGDYEVSVTNAGACSTSEDLKVNKHNPLDELSISQTVNESCKGAENAELEIQNSDSIEGSFDVYVGGEEYQVFNDNQIKGLTAQDNVDVSVEETDERACVYTTTMDIDTLGESDQVQFNSNSTTLASCETASDGSITVQGAGGPDGGYKYKIGDQDYTDEFKSQSHSFDGLLPGTFSVSIMDTAGCEVSMDSIVVGYESNPVSVDAVNVDPASCLNASDGTITIENIEHTDESSMDFSWDGSQVKEVSPKKEMSFSGADSSGLSPGTYSLELVDDNNCAYDTTIDVEHNGYQPGFSRTIEEKVACTGKTNGQVSFELEEGDADDFTFEVFDTSDFADPPVETGDVEEGTSFRVGGLTDQEYFVEVMDSNGCGDTLDFEMPLIAHSLELFSETVPASCEEVDNGELHVSAKGGFPFEDEAYQFSYKKNDSGNWESFEVDSLVLQNLSEGDYFDIKVEDKYGCVVNGDPLSIPVKENKTEIQEINTQNPACRDSLSGAATPLMQWTPETTGYNYKLFSLNDNYEYVDTVSGVLEENNLAINDLKEGLYNLKVVDSDGCQDDMDFRLKDPEPVSVRPEPNYVRVKGENTGEFNLGLAGGNEKYEIAWSELPSEEEFANRDTVAGSSYTVSGLPAGDYFVGVRDTAHCGYFDGDDWFTGKISIEEPEKEFSVVNDTIFDVSCNKLSDGRIDVEVEGGWGGYQYSLDGGESQETGTFDGLTAGEYSVEISDTAGVSVNKTYNVTEPDTLNIFIDNVHDATCPGYANGRVEATVLNGIDKEEGLRYRAENTEDRSAVFGEMYDDRDYRFNELPKGDYELFVTDSNNCVASKTFSIDEPDTVPA
ncbi:MAG: SprB repeat-containing protein [Marinilabiliaceae bacterium]